ncbi:MAG: lipid-A-disaccharide synthase N-terminal domain-containing protein [Gammaproteobacteria bacterium]
MTLLAYAVHRLDPVFILGQATGFIIYLRNLYFVYRQEAGISNA